VTGARTRTAVATGVSPLVEAVRQYQERQGLSHDEMAARLRLSTRGLSYLYSAERNPNVATLGLILQLPIPGIDQLALEYVRRAVP
jgi:transcriptional regulator with XRE-family HTH domain